MITNSYYVYIVARPHTFENFEVPRPRIHYEFISR